MRRGADGGTRAAISTGCHITGARNFDHGRCGSLRPTVRLVFLTDCAPRRVAGSAAAIIDCPHLPSSEPIQLRERQLSALREILGIFRRRLLILVGVTFVVTGAIVGLSATREKQYTATAKLLFRDPGLDQKLFGAQAVVTPRDPTRDAATNVSLVGLDTVFERAAAALGDGTTDDDIADHVEIAAVGQADVVSVAARDHEPAVAAKLANTVAQQYIRFRRDADRAKIDEAVSVVRQRLSQLLGPARNGAEGASVKRQIDELRVLRSLQTGNAELVQPAKTPEDPSSPKPVRDGLLGLLLGGLLAIGLAVLVDRLDGRLRTRDEAATLFERPILAEIGYSKQLRDEVVHGLALIGRERDAFRGLHTNLRYFDIDQDIRSLLITSSAPGDGKSTIVRYLAATAAASDVSVVLVEADLRRPTLVRIYEGLKDRGLTDVLADQVPVEDVVQQLPISIGGLPDPGRTLDVITSGSVPPNPTDLLESSRMRDVLSELEESYDLVIVDCSPLTVVPDAIPIVNLVSGVIVVVREGKTTTAKTRQLRSLLDNMSITPLGVVINDASGQDGVYGNYYDHSAQSNGSGSPLGEAEATSRWSALRR